MNMKALPVQLVLCSALFLIFLVSTAAASESPHEKHMKYLQNMGCYDGKTVLAGKYIALCEKIKKSDGVLANMAGVKKRTTSLDQKINDIKEVFARSIQAESDLKKIDTVIGTLSTLISMAEAIPSISEEASKFRQGVDKVKTPVNTAKKKFTDFNNKMAPVYKALIAMDKTTKDIIQAEGDFSNLVGDYISVETTAYQCVNKEKIASTELDNETTYATEKLTTLNSDLIKAIAAYDSAAKRLDLIAYIDKQISQFSPLKSIENDISKMYSDLDGIEKQLKKIKHLIDKKVEFKIDYGFGTYKLKFKVSTIVKGIKHVEHEIKKVLSSVVYDAAKEIGLGKIFKDLEKDANKIMGSALKDLHLNINLTIPGLSKLEALESAAVEDMEKKFNDALTSIEALEKYVSLKGIKLPNLTYDLNPLSEVYEKLRYYEREAEKYECNL